MTSRPNPAIPLQDGVFRGVKCSKKPLVLSIIGVNAGKKSFWIAGDACVMACMKKAAKKRFDGFSEFVDDEGKKWIQTSTEDLFSIKELNEIIDAIEKKDEGGEDIVLARIDFQRVNKDYYEKVQELQEKLKKRTELLKRLAVESKQLIRSKNRKLRELIEYIKKLHFLLAYYNLNPEEIERMKTPPHIVESIAARTEAIRKEAAAVEEEIEFTPVEEMLIDEEGKETVPVSSLD